MAQRSSIWYGLAAVALVGGFLTFAAVRVVRGLTPEPAEPVIESRPPTDLDVPGEARPAARAAAAAQLGDDEPVVGVEVDGRARAYVLGALAWPHNHVVNDVLGRTPVTVTYCDLRDCVRVFTGDGSDPLDVRTGGFDRGLVLVVGRARYYQETAAAAGAEAPQFPYRPIEFVRTTWKEWRDAHPDTEVVTDPSSRAVVAN